MGEQPLAKNAACNLGSINLLPFVVDPFKEAPTFNFNGLRSAVRIAVRALDKILDENMSNHAIPEQRSKARMFRNIGLGIMGLADCLIAMKFKYGSKTAISFCEAIMKTMFETAVLESINLASDYGPFPGYTDKVWDSAIVTENLPNYIIKLGRKYGIRNCSLLSIAPTGSLATMLNISGGCEPHFALEYNRTTKSLNGDADKVYKVYPAIVNMFKTLYNESLPSYFVSSEDIPWKERVDMQAALQQYCDTAISSTVNLPENISKEEIEQLYLYAWKKGLKGITIFRSGCKRMAILSTKEVVTDREAPKRPKKLEADCYQIKVKGESFIVLVGMFDNKPYEVFVCRSNGDKIPEHKGTITKVRKMLYRFDSDLLHIDNLRSEGIEETAATLYSSMLLRHGVDINYIIKTAKKVNDNITSFSSAMCRILAKYTSKSVVKGEVCPECGGTIIREGGCKHCDSCSWSACMLMLTNNKYNESKS